MVFKPAIIIGTFIGLAITSVSAGLILHNDFTPIGNFLAIAGVGLIPAGASYLAGKYGVDLVRKAVWSGISAFAFVMAAYVGLCLYQRPYVEDGSLPVFVALGCAAVAAVVMGLISYVYGRKKE